MTEMKAYCIAATFADGSIVIQHTVAESESAATMIAGIELGKRDVEPIVGFSCVELPTSWLQSALRAVEGKRPSADVVSLVRPDQQQADPAAWTAATGTLTSAVFDNVINRGCNPTASVSGAYCRMHPWAQMVNGTCMTCMTDNGVA